MVAKYNEIRKRIKEYMEDTGGEGSWNAYVGSQMEEDIIGFLESEYGEIKPPEYSECRIWSGEGLTWSTITDMLDENTEQKLKQLTLDLADNWFALQKELEVKKKELEKVELRIESTMGNLGSCVNFGRRRLSYTGDVSYVHDKEDKVVTIIVRGQDVTHIVEKPLILPKCTNQ